MSGAVAVRVAAVPPAAGLGQRFTLAFLVYPGAEDQSGEYTLRNERGSALLSNDDATKAAVGSLLVSAARAYGPGADQHRTPQELGVTPRMLEVLKHLCTDGASNRAIARRMKITESTVKFHMDALASKLEADNRTHLVVIAVKRGLVAL